MYYWLGQEGPVQDVLYVVDISVKCPACGIKFRSRQLPVVLDTGYRNSELRQDFKGAIPNVEPYLVTSCPSCGRSDWINNFPVIEEEATVAQQVTEAHLMYRAAALGAERGGRDFYNVAMFYLYAAWCADDSALPADAREYRLLAADAFQKSLLDNSCPLGSRMEIEYLIGEILRRAGEFEPCRAHFNKVLPRLSSQFALMARKLMRLSADGNAGAIDFEAEGG